VQLKAIHANCSGCRTCLLACVLENHQEVRPSMAVLKVQGLFPSPGSYRIQLCDQCGACAEACPVGAIVLDGSAYRVQEEDCIQCWECLEACPKGVMVFHPAAETPLKCSLCGACVQACPREAIVWAEETDSAEV